MKRLLALTLVLLVPFGVAVIVLASESGFPDHAQAVLQQYTERPSLKLVQAQRPWEFTAAMSAASFGQSARFQTDGAGGLPTARLDPAVLGPPNDGRVPLPYPPHDIWCARLERGAASQPAVVFIAYHQDLYNGAWIVHEPVGPALRDTLTAVGCDLRLP